MDVIYQESYSGKGDKYILLQARCHDGKLHVQGKGPITNRDYGVSDLIPLSVFTGIKLPHEKPAHNQPLSLFLKQYDPEYKLKSLAGSHYYWPFLAKKKGDKLHCQIKTFLSYNRPYGIAFDMSLVGEDGQEPALSVFFNKIADPKYKPKTAAMPAPKFVIKAHGKKYLTKKIVKNAFVNFIKPKILKPHTKHKLADAWNAFTYDLAFKGNISQKQYNTWLNPYK